MSESIFCVVCDTSVSRDDLIEWSGDDLLHFLCPGCNNDLLEPIDPEKEDEEEE